jgi:hypothetical protein
MHPNRVAPATPVRAASAGASTVVASSAAKNTVPESRPTAVSETEKSSLRVEVTGPMLPAFQDVPAASRTTASVTRLDVSVVAIGVRRRGFDGGR